MRRTWLHRPVYNNPTGSSIVTDSKMICIYVVLRENWCNYVIHGLIFVNMLI